MDQRILIFVVVMMLCCSSSSMLYLFTRPSAEPTPTPTPSAPSSSDIGDAALAAYEAAQPSRDAAAAVKEAKANMTTSEKARAGFYRSFKECHDDSEGDFGSMGRFVCCDGGKGFSGPRSSDGEGYLFCLDNT